MFSSIIGMIEDAQLGNNDWWKSLTVGGKRKAVEFSGFPPFPPPLVPPSPLAGPAEGPCIWLPGSRGGFGFIGPGGSL